MNKIEAYGNIVRDPEVRYTGTGKAVSRFTLASNRGGKSEATDFLDVSAWEQLSDVAMAFTKGTFVKVQGRIETRTYGQKRREALSVSDRGPDHRGVLL